MGKNTIFVWNSTKIEKVAITIELSFPAPASGPRKRSLKSQRLLRHQFVPQVRGLLSLGLCSFPLMGGSWHHSGLSHLYVLSSAASFPMVSLLPLSSISQLSLADVQLFETVTFGGGIFGRPVQHSLKSRQSCGDNLTCYAGCPTERLDHCPRRCIHLQYGSHVHRNQLSWLGFAPVTLQFHGLEITNMLLPTCQSVAAPEKGWKGAQC